MKDNNLDLSSKCPLLLANCRNILGITKYNQQNLLSFIVALLAGIAGALIMVSSLKGKRQRRNSSVEFTRIEEKTLI